jgi:hypothetical protein
MNDTDTTFTLDELLIALQGAQITEGADGAVRMADLVAATGIGEVTLAKRLRALISAGRVETVRVPFQRIDGVWTRVGAYRLVQRD